MSQKQKASTGQNLCNTWGADPPAQPICNRRDCQFNGGVVKGVYKKPGAGLGSGPVNANGFP